MIVKNYITLGLGALPSVSLVKSAVTTDSAKAALEIANNAFNAANGCVQPGGSGSPRVRQPTTSEVTAGCKLAAIPCPSPTTCPEGKELRQTPCGPWCVSTSCQPYYTPTGDWYQSCQRDPNVLTMKDTGCTSGVTAQGVVACACPSGTSPGGVSPNGTLLCVTCKEGFYPDPTSLQCIPNSGRPTSTDAEIVTPDLLPWRTSPMAQRFSQTPLPAVFYERTRRFSLRTGSGATSDHRRTDQVVLDRLHPTDRAEWEKHRRDKKTYFYDSKNGMMAERSVYAGEIPFETWQDPLTKLPLGAFMHLERPQLDSNDWSGLDIVIKPWDPYTLSDVFDDIVDFLKGVVCSPITSMAAPAATSTCGLDPATTGIILQAAKNFVGCGSIATATTTDSSLTVTGPQYPPGSIQRYHKSKQVWRVYIPVGSTLPAGLGDAPPAGLVLAKESPTEVPNVPKGEPEDDAFYQKPWFWIATSVGVLGAAGGTWYYVKRKRGR